MTRVLTTRPIFEHSICFLLVSTMEVEVAQTEEVEVEVEVAVDVSVVVVVCLSVLIVMAGGESECLVVVSDA